MWCEVPEWLQEDPDASAVALLGRLQSTHPGPVQSCSPATLQRRVQKWRGIMASKLVYPAPDETTPDQHSLPELELLEVAPGTEIWVTFPNEATGIGKNA